MDDSWPVGKTIHVWLMLKDTCLTRSDSKCRQCISHQASPLWKSPRYPFTLVWYAGAAHFGGRALIKKRVKERREKKKVPRPVRNCGYTLGVCSVELAEEMFVELECQDSAITNSLITRTRKARRKNEISLYLVLSR